MNVLGWLLGACVVLAVVQAIAKMLALGLCLAVVVGACIRPRQTFALLALLGSVHLVQAQPTAVIVMLCCFTLLVFIASQSPST